MKNHWPVINFIPKHLNLKKLLNILIIYQYKKERGIA